MSQKYNYNVVLAAWGERSKQIAKIWRGLSAEARAPFLQQARENRAASRMQKAQQVKIVFVYFFLAATTVRTIHRQQFVDK